MDIVPPDPSGVTLAGAIAGDAMTGTREAAKLFDIDVQEVTGVFALIAPRWLFGGELR